MRRGWMAAALCAAGVAAWPASADDSSAALGMGGIVFTQSSDIRMTDEDLFVSPKAVRIRFTFRNDSGRDIDAMLGFPLPDINTAEFTASPIGTVTADPVNFVGFTVRADGVPMRVSADQRAYFNGRDVTALVRSLGLPVNVITEAGYKALENLPADKRRILAADDLAEFDGDNAMPHWIVRTNFYWHQKFPAGRSVVLEQAYQPVTGQFFFGSYDFAQADKNTPPPAEGYCVDAATRAGLERRLAAKLRADPQAGGYLNGFETDYVLKTGNNWKGPIGRFHLTLDKLAPDNVLSLCWSGTLTKTGPTTFEDRRENFAPDRDIRLLVVSDRPL